MLFRVLFRPLMPIVMFQIVNGFNKNNNVGNVDNLQINGRNVMKCAMASAASRKASSLMSVLVMNIMHSQRVFAFY